MQIYAGMTRADGSHLTDKQIKRLLPGNPWNGQGISWLKHQLHAKPFAWLWRRQHCLSHVFFRFVERDLLIWKPAGFLF